MHTVLQDLRYSVRHLIKNSGFTLNVKLDGSSYLLWKDDKDSIEWAFPSPDGKLLAINKYTGITNVWSLANF